MALISTFIDDFSFADTTKWQHFGGGAWSTSEYVSAGELVLVPTANFDAHLISINSFDFTASSAYIKIVERPLQQSANETELRFQLVDSADQNDFLAMILTGNGNIGCEQRVNGSAVSSTWPSYNSAAHPWVRFRHSGSTIYWEKSADGVSWTQVFSAAKNKNLAITSMKIELESGFWGAVTQATAGLARVDNLNTLTSSPAVNSSSFFQVL